jgi:dephospho-CoA kinase
MLVGITGGLATGKSAVTEMLRGRGAVVFSADEAARAVAADRRVLGALAAQLGRDILTEGGALDRARLAKRIFSDGEARARVNAIMHPAILRLLRAQIDAAREDLPADALIAVEVPLLYETNLSGWFERIVVVGASEPTQIARLIARNGIDEAEARRRLKTQQPIADKASRADYVVHNEGSLEDLQRAVEHLWGELKQSEPARA